jgi:hypothetical protein
MRTICFALMMLIAGTGMAAGLGQLFDSLKKPPVTAPAPQAPKTTPPPPPPPPPTPKSPTK